MMPFSEFLAIGIATAAGTAIPVMLLQYLVLGFFSPLRLFEAKSPPAEFCCGSIIIRSIRVIATGASGSPASVALVSGGMIWFYKSTAAACP
jgi:hypothetical protein